MRTKKITAHKCAVHWKWQRVCSGGCSSFISPLHCHIQCGY